MFFPWTNCHRVHGRLASRTAQLPSTGRKMRPCAGLKKWWKWVWKRVGHPFGGGIYDKKMREYWLTSRLCGSFGQTQDFCLRVLLKMPTLKNLSLEIPPILVILAAIPVLVQVVNFSTAFSNGFGRSFGHEPAAMMGPTLLVGHRLESQNPNQRPAIPD